MVEGRWRYQVTRQHQARYGQNKGRKNSRRDILKTSGHLHKNQEVAQRKTLIPLYPDPWNFGGVEIVYRVARLLKA